MDRPSALSLHREPIPRAGGLAMLAAFLLALLPMNLASDLDIGGRMELVGLVFGSVLIGAVGLWDDAKEVSPKTRLLGQGVAALIAVSLGVRASVIPNPVLAVPLAFFYLVGGANAMNLLDGMDGLAAGVTVIASLCFALLFWGQGDAQGLNLSVALSGSALGFLYHNFPRARIFMGDCGSLFLGFTMAALALRFGQPYDIATILAPLLVLALPIVDTTWAILRRLARRKNVLSGDRGHVYDRVMARGLSPAGTVLACYLVQACCSAAALGIAYMASF